MGRNTSTTFYYLTLVRVLSFLVSPFICILTDRASSVSLQFESRPIAGRPPAARGYHASILADSRLFVFGGFSGHDVFDDVHVLDLAAAAYLPQVTSFRVEV